MKEIGLVLEGGGMRGVYTSGVLEFFMEKELYFPYVVGVSAGACNACSYISKQPGRNKKVTIDYVSDPRYLSYRNLFKERSLFGMDFIFDEIPNKHVPFDFDQFHQSEQKFIIGTTDCHTGKPSYFSKDEGKDVLKLIRASSSLPFFSKEIEVEGKYLLDGGIADPIPIEKAIADGYSKNIVILTQNKGYIKTPLKHKWLIKFKYPEYKGLLETMEKRHHIYNETIKKVENLESQGKVFIIRPSQGFKVSRIEKKKERLEKLYQMGYQDGSMLYEKLVDWL